MKGVRIAHSYLSAVTDEKGDFLFDPEGPKTSRQRVQKPFAHRRNRLFIPATVYEAPLSRQEKSLGSMLENIGLSVVRILGVESMPCWLPILLLMAVMGILFTIVSFRV